MHFRAWNVFENWLECVFLCFNTVNLKTVSIINESFVVCVDISVLTQIQMFHDSPVCETEGESTKGV